MVELNGKQYTFFVDGVEYDTLEHAEDAVEELCGSEYNNIDYRNEYSDQFFDDCESNIDIYDDENNLLYYSEFFRLYY